MTFEEWFKENVHDNEIKDVDYFCTGSASKIFKECWEMAYLAGQRSSVVGISDKDKKIMDAGFDHPCKETCSGWKAGYDRAVHDSTRTQVPRVVWPEMPDRYTNMTEQRVWHETMIQFEKLNPALCKEEK